MAFRCVGMGEVLLDLLPAGRQLGGAPANFAYHAAALGAEAGVVSRIGDDSDGRALLLRLRELGLPTNTLEVDPSAPTGTVGVALGSDGHPVYTIHENVAWDRIAGEAAGAAAVQAADAVCFGTLAQRSPAARRTIRTLLRHTRPAALRIFDVNLRQHFYSQPLIAESLALASILKVNETELPRLADLLDLPAGEAPALEALAARHSLRAVIHTRGANGCLVLAGGRWAEHPGQPVALADTIGAGDSFTAAFTLGLLHGWSLDTVVARAIAASAYVCSQPGATPRLPAALTAPFHAAGASA